ncbi:MAG TPA: amidohydrolase family protein [Bryobacteraceae bacterium]|jgi:2,3-dihydroxybenzoate decarboxylase|nr:amidohydrolase family protein [Bryobacteraceae bacterium]
MSEPTWRRIATEEAFAPPEILDRYRVLLQDGSYNDPGFRSLCGFYLGNANPRITEVIARMTDLGDLRLRDMDQTGIARQILSLTAPGVQVFDGPEAVALARSSNDFMVDAIRKHPDRFSGLAAIAPQDSAAAAKELERGVRSLGLKGAIVNSHTRGEYLDDPKFWPIFEAAEALDVPVYIHPTALSSAMIAPFLDRGMDGAIYGFAVETGLHILRIIVSGVFDRFPKLKIVVGHLGEGLPYWLFRIDFMHNRMVTANRYAGVQKLQRKPSDYVRENLYVTTSGMAWEPPILYAQSVLGMDRVLYAMDYPYQFVPEEVAVTDNLPISDADKMKLYQTNAEKVFGL